MQVKRYVASCRLIGQAWPRGTSCGVVAAQCKPEWQHTDSKLVYAASAARRECYSTEIALLQVRFREKCPEHRAACRLAMDLDRICESLVQLSSYMSFKQSAVHAFALKPSAGCSDSRGRSMIRGVVCSGSAAALNEVIGIDLGTTNSCVAVMEGSVRFCPGLPALQQCSPQDAGAVSCRIA